jgi:hypothetical protein
LLSRTTYSNVREPPILLCLVVIASLRVGASHFSPARAGGFRLDGTLPVPSTLTITATDPPCRVCRGVTVAVSVNDPTSPLTKLFGRPSLGGSSTWITTSLDDFSTRAPICRPLNRADIGPVARSPARSGIRPTRSTSRAP